MTKRKQLSAPMRNMLTNLANGRGPTAGMGCNTAPVWVALHRRGMLERGQITPAGLAAIGRGEPCTK